MADDLARSESFADEYPVYCGVWTNWDRGAIMGSTLTLRRSDAEKLIAFTAFFVTIVSSRFWSLAAFIYHRWYSTQDPRDALHHQRQAILRNSVSALSDSLQLLLLSWTWRGSVARGVRRTLPVTTFALVCVAGFAAASVLSSWISTAFNDEVLISGKSCGIIPSFGGDMAFASLADPYKARHISNAANYAKQCYTSESTRMFDCTLFVKDHLPSSIDQKAPCPFNSEICRTDSSNLYLDTGFLDSGKHFGLNTLPSESVLFRSVLHCAPLVTEGYTSTRNTTSANYTRYHYGGAHVQLSSLAPDNLTYEYLSRDSQYEVGEDTRVYDIYRSYGSDLILTGMDDYREFESVLNNHTTSFYNSVFMPIPELFRPDGNIQVIFLAGNRVQFYEQTEDEWYRGTFPGNKISENVRQGERTVYWPEEAASPLGCVEQVQFCNGALSADKRCGPLAGWNDAVYESAQLFNMTGLQMYDEEYFPTDPIASRCKWFMSQLENAATGLHTLLQTLRSEALASKANLNQGIMGRLASNQWQLDVTHWWSTYLASMQVAFMEVAIGPNDPTGELEQYKIVPWNDHVRKLCNSQKIRSSSYTSFSMFGLCFTYAIGILVIVASFAIGSVYTCLYRRFGFKEYAHLEWTTNAALHLQRMAYQGINSGEWTGEMDDIPRTKPGENLANLPMRAAAIAPIDASEKNSTSDQTEQTTRSLRSIACLSMMIMQQLLFR